MNKEYELNSLLARLNKIQEKVLYYKNIVAKNIDVEEKIDFDIMKILKSLELKSKDLDIKNIEENINSFYFLLELWEKDLELIENYFFDNYSFEKENIH